MQRPQQVEVKLRTTLEELYKGSTRKLKLNRNVTTSKGQTTRACEVVEVVICPGWKSDAKVTLAGKGDEHSGQKEDLVLIIEQLPHAHFSRDGNDLLYTHRLRLVEALCGTELTIQHLDDSYFSVPISHVIQPDSQKVFAGKGMPVTDNPSLFGDLRITFKVTFPATLSAEHREQMQLLLNSCT